jgi:hypothetical protein
MAFQKMHRYISVTFHTGSPLDVLDVKIDHRNDGLVLLKNELGEVLYNLSIHW